MARKKNQRQDSHQRETINNKFKIFTKLGRQESWGEQNACMYVSGICAEGIFVSFFMHDSKM